MQELLSSDIWGRAAKLAKEAKTRRAALAYFTKDHLKFKKGDVLVVNASNAAIASGSTSAKLLASLYGKGVVLYNWPNLHAKVILLDSRVVIGSANASANSEANLIEAALITDHPATVAGTRAFLRQLMQSPRLLGANEIKALLKIPKLPNPIGREPHGQATGGKVQVGNTTWLFGSHELLDSARPSEKLALEAGLKLAQQRRESGDADDDWLRLALNSRFAKKVRPGDIVIQLSRSAGVKKPQWACRPSAVVLRHVEPTCIRLHFEDLPGPGPQTKTIASFTKLLKEIGFTKRLVDWPVRALDANTADLLVRRWGRPHGRK